MRTALAANPKVLLALRLLNGAIWFGFGFYAKVLGAVPRHQLIVARVLGEQYARPLVIAVGLGEVVLAAWIVSGRFPRTCAGLQTLALVSMNTLELVFARDLLLSPWGMVAANAVLLTLAWGSALATTATPGSG